MAEIISGGDARRLSGICRDVAFPDPAWILAAGTSAQIFFLPFRAISRDGSSHIRRNVTQALRVISRRRYANEKESALIIRDRDCLVNYSADE